VIGPQSRLRFAVATFDKWDALYDAWKELSLDGLRSDTFSCLGLQRVLSGTIPLDAVPTLTTLQELPFPGNVHLICCTAGLLAQCLTARLHAGAPSLRAALGHWLIPRHASLLEDSIERGRIILWVQLFDNESERRAYQRLLARSSNSVGVHDIDIN
jgi:hypothetical protein